MHKAALEIIAWRGGVVRAENWRKKYFLDMLAYPELGLQGSKIA